MPSFTSLTSMTDRQLDRLVKRLALILVLGTVAFGAFYFFDRWRAPTTPIIDQRLAALEQAVQDAPDDIAARGQLADTYVAKGRFQDAVAQYSQILATGKADELASYRRAAAYMGLGELDAAAKDYRAVVEIATGGEMANVDPMLEASYYGLGSIAMKQAEPAEAIPWLEKALAIKRSDADALYLVGTAFLQTGNTGKAVTTLRAAVAFVPIGWAEPYVALAEAHTKAGKPAQAEWAGAMADLAGGKPDTAEARLTALLDGDAAVDAAIGLGLLAESRGHSAVAAGWYEKALASDPGNNVARLGLSRVSASAAASPLPELPTPGVPSVSSN